MSDSTKNFASEVTKHNYEVTRTQTGEIRPYVHMNVQDVLLASACLCALVLPTLIVIVCVASNIGVQLCNIYAVILFPVVQLCVAVFIFGLNETIVAFETSTSICVQAMTFLWFFFACTAALQIFWTLFAWVYGGSKERENEKKLTVDETDTP